MPKLRKYVVTQTKEICIEAPSRENATVMATAFFEKEDPTSFDLSLGIALGEVVEREFKVTEVSS